MRERKGNKRSLLAVVAQVGEELFFSHSWGGVQTGSTRHVGH
jgi:hypothetical protein